jgi:AraC family transcriptional regulator
MQLIEQELLQAGPMSELKLRHLLALMAIDVVQLRQTSDDAALLSPAQRRRLDQYARKNITRRPSPSELAEVVGLSPDYFSRIFRRTYGTPPRDWLIRERIREASRMLTSTTLATYQVADHLGYANVSQFSRQFSQAMGMSPGRYRRQN